MLKKVKIHNKIFSVTVHDGSNEEEFWDLVGKGYWEWDTYRVFDQFLDKEHSYIDIGAWIGPTVLYASQIAGHCYAIEPNGVAFKVLVENINLNPGLRSKITLFNGCIGNVSGDVKLGTMTSFEDSMSSISFAKPRSDVIVKSVTLDEFTKTNNIRDCNFIKMDVEGGESLILPSMKAYLQKNDPTLFLSLHPFWFKNREQDSKQVMDVLRIYEHLYYADGRRLQPNRLLNILLSLGNCNFSILATNKWNFGRRLPYILKARAHQLVARWLMHP
jgi:FkbM family methyltransferase